MKKLLYILMIFVIAFSACDPNEDIYDELDGLREPYKAPLRTLTFTEDDYAAAVKYAKIDAVSVGDADSSIAKLIGSMEAFNPTYTAEDYVGKVVGDMFPEYGKNSAALVTYNYVEEDLGDLTKYTDATEYVFESADYESIDVNVGIAQYFYPEFNPDFYIPGMLETLISSADSGDVYKIKYGYAEENPVISTTTEFFEGFDGGLGQFTATDVTGPKDWYGSSYGGEYYASMSGFVYGTGATENEDWLISKPIVLDNSGSISFNFTHEINYMDHGWSDLLSVAISDDYDGSDIAGATWDVIDWADVADTALVGGGYDAYNSGDLDITSYANKTIYIAFKYTSTTEDAPTWHILDVEVNPIKEVGAVIYGEIPYSKNDYYEYDGVEWEKQDVYQLTSKDYAAMGDPGDDDSFNANALPQDYLPNFLNAMYPSAGEGVVKTIIYQYYSNLEDDEITLATEYTYKSGAWVSAYDYIKEATNQFIHNGTAWLFDPTITVDMSSSNYQFIVEYVKSKYGDALEIINKYGTADFVYGADSYYSEFDINDFDPDHEEFADMEDPTWEDAVEKALGTLLLPSLYPEPPLQVNGVDMHYRVVFLTYDYGKEVYYAMKFQVTKTGPDPEFTLVETTEL